MPVWSNTPHTWAVGEKLTALLLNAEVRDPLAALGGQWNAYTPQIDQGSAVNVGKTVTYAKYLKFGKLVICQTVLQLTAAGSGAGSEVSIALPVPAAVSAAAIGSGGITDLGVGFRNATVFLRNTTTMRLVRTDAVANAGLGQDPVFALASGDIIYASITYEAA